MQDLLNQASREKARELARKITVAHDLDPEIQEELYGHIEDKLLAYTSSEERVSDDDAFILVREHFGDTKVLASLFARVHQEIVAQDQVGQTALGYSLLDRGYLNTGKRIPIVFSCILIGAAGWVQDHGPLTLDVLSARVLAAVFLMDILIIHFVSIPREMKRGSTYRVGALSSMTIFLMAPAAFFSVYALLPVPIANDSRNIVALAMFVLSMAGTGAMAWASWRKVVKDLQRNDIVQR